MRDFQVGDKVRVSKAGAWMHDAYKGRFQGEMTIKALIAIPGEEQPIATLDSGTTVNCGWLELVPPALITLDGKYQTRDGRAVRIFALDGVGKHSVMGACMEDEGWAAKQWTADGLILDAYRERDYDLVPVPEKPKEHERWIAVSPNGGFETQEMAQEFAAKIGASWKRAGGAVVRVKFTAGEGL